MIFETGEGQLCYKLLVASIDLDPPTIHSEI